MSAPLVIPFDNSPEATYVEVSGSFLIPEGYRARVTFMSGNAAIESDFVYQSQAWGESLASGQTRYVKINDINDVFTFKRLSGTGTLTITYEQCVHGAATSSPLSFNALTISSATPLDLFGGITAGSSLGPLYNSAIPANGAGHFKLVTSVNTAVWETIVRRYTGPITTWVNAANADITVYCRRMIVELYKNIA
jgi:hypothetical protein